MADKIEKAVKVPGAIAVRQIRMRKSGPTVFVDVRVAVENCLSIERTHEIADNIEDAVMAVAPGSDVVVHTEPADENPSDPAVIAKTLAQKYGMAAHSIRCSEDSPRTLELHLEVDRTLTLQAAHDKAERFEREFVDKQPDFSRVISHIEPAETNHSYIPVGDDMNERILESANGFFRDNGVPCNAHEISVSRRGDKLSISLHCEMEGNISIVEAHELSSRLELHLRKKAPTVRHVTIHVEPLKSA